MRWIALMILIAPCVQSDELSVSLATLPDYPPFCFLKPNMQAEIEEIIKPRMDSKALQGYAWDIVKESYHSQGYIIKLNIRPWPRALKSVKTGSIDALFPTGKNQERETYFAFSNKPVTQVKFLVYFNQSQQIDWEGLESLQGLKLGAMRGYNYGNEWNEAGLKTYEINSIKQGFDLLKLKRISGFVGYEFIWDHYLKMNNPDNLFKKSPAFDATFEYLAVSTSTSHSKKILRAFDEGISRLKQTGRLQAILKKWE